MFMSSTVTSCILGLEIPQTHLTNLMAWQNNVHHYQVECQSVFHLSFSDLHVWLIDMLVGD